VLYRIGENKSKFDRANTAPHCCLQQLKQVILVAAAAAAGSDGDAEHINLYVFSTQSLAGPP
jgi:hypothetical protein